MVKKIKLFVNNNDNSKKVEKIVREKLATSGFNIVNNSNYDLGIGIGGDGCFIRMIKSSGFNSDALYVGINSGTLGFAQEIELSGIDKFIDDLKNDNYKITYIGVQESIIKTNGCKEKFYSLNEIVLREKDLNTSIFDITVDGAFLENFVGDGILISTSFGSTAYNLSFGGSIIYNDFHTLQITPIAPLNNKAYRSLINSIVIPENKIIKLIPKSGKDNLLVTIDGENRVFEEVKYIETYVNRKTIKLLRNKDYDFAKKVNEKFLK